MQAKSSSWLGSQLFLGMSIASILSNSPARAQEPQKPPVTESQTPVRQPQAPDQAGSGAPVDPNPPASGQEADSQKPPVEPVLGVDTNQYQIQAIGKASNLLTANSPLRLGPVYVASASAFYLSASGLEQNPTTLQYTNATGNAAVFLTDVVFDHIFGRKRFAIQYSPEITIVNGHLLNDFTNTSLSLDTKYLLSPRVVLTLGDEFTSRNSKLIGVNGAISMDDLLGTTETNPVLGSSSRYMADQLRSNLTYLLSAHDQLVVTPIFAWENTNVSGTPTSSYTYGATVAFDHAFTRRISAGLFYSVEDRSFSGQLANALYNSFGVSFNYHFAPSWSFSGTVAATEAAVGGGSEWTTTGSASLVKAFRRSSAGITFYRGNRFDPFLTNRFATRYDGTYSYSLTRRWSVSATGSYEYGTFSSTSSVPETLYGTYVTGRTNFRLRNTVSLTAAYAKRWQHGSNHEIIPGAQNSYTVGIAWTAPQRPELY